jgi:tRNA wybutosine-synthesizing protein 4
MNTVEGSDSAVQATNDEAVVAKLSAVRRGYFKDPYILALCDALSSPISSKAPPRQPMINRGTYARVSFVRGMVTRFLAALRLRGPVQVVSFGAGFDTLPFTLIADNQQNGLTKYVELDFSAVIRGKVDAMASSPLIASLFETMVRSADGGVQAQAKSGGATYVASECDLRDPQRVLQVIKAAGIDSTRSTVFITECVLVYMLPAASDALIRMAHDEFSGVRAFVNYEPIMPHDPFGKQMVLNISMRGSPLLGIDKYRTVELQKSRFLDAGWSDVTSVSMLHAFTAFLNSDDVKRINSIEMLDEVEEWKLMMTHYCFVWAISAPRGQEYILEALSLASLRQSDVMTQTNP